MRATQDKFEVRTITTRMSQALWDAIDTAAKKAGLRQSAFVRTVLAVQVGKLRMPSIPVDAKELRRRGKGGMR